MAKIFFSEKWNFETYFFVWALERTGFYLFIHHWPSRQAPGLPDPCDARQEWPAWGPEKHFLEHQFRRPLKTTFLGNGKAVLNYGNCYYKGQVKVLLNKKQISSAKGNVISKNVTFNYFKGDRLMIKKVNVAIIKLNSLEILK